MLRMWASLTLYRRISALGVAVEKLMKPKDVAKRLRVSEGALAQMRYRGIGPNYVKINARNVRYRATDVHQWIETKSVALGEADR